MKLIIDVPEEVYEALKGIAEDTTSLDPYSLADIIVNKSKPDRPVSEWMPITTRPATEKEKEETEELVGYPCDRIYNCKLPDDGQVVLITTTWGEVSMDVYVEDGCYFEDHEDMDEVLAWMPLPRAYEMEEEP